MAEGCTIRVNRRWQTEVSTISDFLIEGTPVKGYVLEEKGPSSPEERKQLRIPAGHYKLVWHYNGKFGHKVPKLYNHQVSPNRLILIHPGNTAEHTEGCLLVGQTRSPNRVDGSKLKFGELMAVLDKADISKCTLVIEEDFQ